MDNLCISTPDLTTPSRVAFDALQLIDDAVICTDENGRILLFNRAAERGFGYSAAETIGQPVEILLPLPERTKHALQVQGYLVEGTNLSRFMGAKREVTGRRKDGTEFPTEAILSRHLVDGSTILTVVHRDITERKKLEQQREVIAQELDHRIRNIFAVVNSLVLLTAPGSESVKDFKETLLRRLSTLARTQGVLRAGAPWTSDLKEVLLDEIASYQTNDGGNILIKGPLLAVSADAAQTLALIFHELATNSAKYGAFSCNSGLVTVTYARVGDENTNINIEWRESAGPKVRPPKRQGFGTRLIERIVHSTFGGVVALEYPQDGFVCRMALPAEQVVCAQKKNGKVTKPGHPSRRTDTGPSLVVTN